AAAHPPGRPRPPRRLPAPLSPPRPRRRRTPPPHLVDRPDPPCPGTPRRRPQLDRPAGTPPDTPLAHHRLALPAPPRRPGTTLARLRRHDPAHLGRHPRLHLRRLRLLQQRPRRSRRPQRPPLHRAHHPTVKAGEAPATPPTTSRPPASHYRGRPPQGHGPVHPRRRHTAPRCISPAGPDAGTLPRWSSGRPSALPDGAHDDVLELHPPTIVAGERAVPLLGDGDPPLGGVQPRRDSLRGHRRLGGGPMPVALAAGGVQMPDDQQRPARSHPPGDAVVEVQLRHRRVRIVGRDQLEPPFRLPHAEVRLDPPHTLGD